MTERAFAAGLADLLNGDGEVDEVFESASIDNAIAYDEAGVLTRNAGFVASLEDGTEFQVTVVRSRRGRRDDE